MLLDRLAETWTAVAATRSRNTKRDLLAATLAEAGPGDLEIAVSYLAGSLRQRRPGLGWRGLAALPDPATDPSLTLRQVDEAFETMAALSGPGSANRRSALAADLFARATERRAGVPAWTGARRPPAGGDGRAGAGGHGEGVRRGSGGGAPRRHAALVHHRGREPAGRRWSRGAGGGGSVGRHADPADAGGQCPRPGGRPDQVRRARDRGRQARRHPGAGSSPRRRRPGLHPVAGRDHRAPARGRGGHPDDRCRGAGARRRGAGAAVRRAAGGLPAGGLPHRHPRRRRAGPGAAGVLLRRAARGRAHPARHRPRPSVRPSWSGCCLPSSGSSAPPSRRPRSWPRCSTRRSLAGSRAWW